MLCIARVAFTVFANDAFAEQYPQPSDKIKLLFAKLDEDVASDDEVLFDDLSLLCDSQDDGAHVCEHDQHEWV